MLQQFNGPGPSEATYPKRGIDVMVHAVFGPDYLNGLESRVMQMSDANVFIEHLEKCRPRLIWYVEESTFAEMREMRDVAGVNLWQPDMDQPELPGTFLSCEISISDVTSTELGYVFPDGTEKRFPMSG